ncbi:MAG: hypothetical protein H6Q51_2579 [Deltaproteobacteria bacterium]|jgi:hypothetical protein|nr:hypothetical protein [Deltaproteobacteria bacterium]
MKFLINTLVGYWILLLTLSMAAAAAFYFIWLREALM